MHTTVSYAELLTHVHRSWRPIIEKALATMATDYIEQLYSDDNWLPGTNHCLRAFSLPLSQTQYVLFGESPYPRAASANGYAFWDNAVTDLWSTTGLHKVVNRATSLRNLLKMLLLANDDLSQDDLSQEAILRVDKHHKVKTVAQLFQNFMQHGILLLNATPVLSQRQVTYEAREWQPFMTEVLNELSKQRSDIQLILLGRIAERITQIPAAAKLRHILAPHPYNVSFITNPVMLDLFRPMNLLRSIE